MAQPASTARCAVEADQLDRLRRLLRAVMADNAFYRSRLLDAGIDPDTVTLDDFRARVPFTLKSDLIADQQRHPPYGTNLTHPIDRYTRFHQTSGTTGSPLRWLDTPQSWDWMLDSWRCVYESAGVTGGDRIFFAFSFGPFLGFWTAYDSAVRMGAMCIPGGGLSSTARLRMIIDNRASVLCCTPTYAMRLTEVADDDAIDLSASGVRRIIVAGEPGGSVPAVRDLIEARWPGARVVDHHGMTEVGPVTYEHPRRRGALVVIESAYLAEVIDPATFEPVRPGRAGELVLTTLGREGSPLLRYRTGDLVRPILLDRDGAESGDGDICLDGGILSRADDMLIVRGVNVYPSAIDQVVRAEASVREYRVTVTKRDAMAQIAVDIESDDATAAQRIEAAFRAALALRVPVAVVAPGSLPRHEMKSKRWVQA